MSDGEVVVRDVASMQRFANDVRLKGRRVGVVPTMGCLHEGHLSLIRLARQHSDIVITTVFVNPTQFGPNEDYQRYPRNLERDIHLASTAGTDAVFAPDVKSMYPDPFYTFVDVAVLDSVLEGEFRPGHFKGVATVVTKLFHATMPHVAVFGQKDFQQVLIIRKMVEDLNFSVEIVVAPTVREEDGLAMSSRNTFLNSEQRQQAPVLYQALQTASDHVLAGERSASVIRNEIRDLIVGRSSGIIDYVSVADMSTLKELDVLPGHGQVLLALAVRFGTTRLIDNITVELPS